MLSPVKSGGGAASLLAVAGRIACTDARRFAAFACPWRPSSPCHTLRDMARASKCLRVTLSSYGEHTAGVAVVCDRGCGSCAGTSHDTAGPDVALVFPWARAPGDGRGCSTRVVWTRTRSSCLGEHTPHDTGSGPSPLSAQPTSRARGAWVSYPSPAVLHRRRQPQQEGSSDYTGLLATGGHHEENQLISLHRGVGSRHNDFR
jgi:hypothetical protein